MIFYVPTIISQYIGIEINPKMARWKYATEEKETKLF
jgi:hypothetical protein